MASINQIQFNVALCRIWWMRVGAQEYCMHAASACSAMCVYVCISTATLASKQRCWQHESARIPASAYLSLTVCFMQLYITTSTSVCVCMCFGAHLSNYVCSFCVNNFPFSHQISGLTCQLWIVDAACTPWIMLRLCRKGKLNLWQYLAGVINMCKFTYLE